MGKIVSNRWGALVVVLLQLWRAVTSPHDVGDHEPTMGTAPSAEDSESGDTEAGGVVIMQGVQQAPPPTQLSPGVRSNAHMAPLVPQRRPWSPGLDALGSPSALLAAA